MREQSVILLDQHQEEPESLLQGNTPSKRIYKLVLTGGPCGGKTTGQAELATFMENMGWKVYRVPETATVLMSGGIAFGELNQEQVEEFQENLIRTMITLEDTYFKMAAKSGHNCLIICDRGIMDASAYVDKETWDKLLDKLQLTEINICEKRYDHIVHMVSAANGAEDFYSVEDHGTRFEGLELARERDVRLIEAWKMHPYVDIVDNNKEFETKLKQVVDIVIRRIGLEIGDQFKPNSRKVKFLVKGPLPNDEEFPEFSDFEVVHHYLRTGQRGIQSRLRKRGRNGRWTYTCTVRKPEKKGQSIEVKTSLSKKDYENLLNHADLRHLPIYKTRRCFHYNNQQYRLDIYRDPCHERCTGLVLMETFTTQPLQELRQNLPPFLLVASEVTGDPAFSMYNLALRSEWTERADDFCRHHHDLDSDSENSTMTSTDAAFRAHKRLLSSRSDNCDTNNNSSDYYSSGNEM